MLYLFLDDLLLDARAELSGLKCLLIDFFVLLTDHDLAHEVRLSSAHVFDNGGSLVAADFDSLPLSLLKNVGLALVLPRVHDGADSIVRELNFRPDRAARLGNLIWLSCCEMHELLGHWLGVARLSSYSGWSSVASSWVVAGWSCGPDVVGCGDWP